MTKEKEASAKTGAGALVANQGQVPAYLQGKMGQGSGLKADVEDFIIPRVRLLHGTSKEPETFNTAKAGNYWANTLDISLGSKFDFIVVSNRKRVMLLRPIDDKTGEPILARAEDGKTWDKTGEWKVKLKGRKNADVTWKIENLDVRKSGLLEFGTSDPTDEDSNPAATVFHDYLIYLPAFPQLGPVLFSNARTAAKKAKQLNSKIEMAGGPMQAMVFTASVTKEGDSGQEYFNVEFQRNGFATEDDYSRCVALAERYKSYRGADEEDEAREASPGAAATQDVKDRGEV